MSEHPAEQEHPGAGEPADAVEAPADGTEHTLTVGDTDGLTADEAGLLDDDSPSQPWPYTDSEGDQ